MKTILKVFLGILCSSTWMLALNSDFEQSNRKGLPEEWASYVGTNFSAEYDQFGVGGSLAVGIRSPGSQMDSWSLKKSSAIKVTTGMSYVFAVQAKASGADEDDYAWLRVVWLDGNGKGLARSDSDAWSGDFDWRKIRFTSLAPEGAEQAILSLMASPGANALAQDYEVIYDDLEFSSSAEAVPDLLPDDWEALMSLSTGLPDESSFWVPTSAMGMWRSETSGVHCKSANLALFFDPETDGGIVALIPPEPVELPVGAQRLHFWTTALPLSCTFVLRDNDGEEHRIDARASFPLGARMDKPDGWPLWKHIYSDNFGMPNGLNNRVVPELQQEVAGLLWPHPLRLETIELVVSPGTKEPYAATGLQTLTVPELETDYGWFNLTTGRVGWGIDAILMPADFSRLEGEFRYQAEMRQGYQGDIIWHHQGQGSHFADDPLTQVSQAIPLPKVPRGTYFLDLKSWNLDGTLREEGRMQLYVLKGVDTLPAAIGSSFSLATPCEDNVFPVETQEGTLRLKTDAGDSPSADTMVRFRLYDWRMQLLDEQVMSFEDNLSFDVAIDGQSDLFAVAELRDEKGVLDRARLHFGIANKDELNASWTVPENMPVAFAPNSDVSLVAEYTRPWFSKRYSRYPEQQWESIESMKGYDSWLVDQAIPRGFHHVSNLNPWSDIEVLPGVFRWDESDRRTNFAVEHGATVTAWFGTLGDWPPHVPDWWGGDIMLTQHGYPHLERSGASAARNPTASYWYAEKDDYLKWLRKAITHQRQNPAVTQYKVLMQSFVEGTDYHDQLNDYRTSDYSETFQNAYNEWQIERGLKPSRLPMPYVIPGEWVSSTGPDLSEEWLNFVQFKTDSSLDRLQTVLETIRELDSERPIYVYRGPRTHPATEAAMPLLKANNAYFFDESMPNFFSNALASMSVQAGVRYGSENHFYMPASFEIIDADIFYGTIYNQGWYFSYRWHERFRDGYAKQYYGALDYLEKAMPLIESFALAEAEEPQALVFGSRIDGMVNRNKHNFFANASGVDFYTGLFSYFQVLPHFGTEHTDWVNLNNFKVVFVCGEVMTKSAMERVADYARQGGKLVLVGNAGEYCVEAPQARAPLRKLLHGLPNVRHINEPDATPPPPGMAHMAPYMADSAKMEKLLAWSGVERSVMLLKDGQLDGGFVGMIRRINEESFYVAVQRRFAKKYTSIMNVEENLKTWGRASTTVSLTGLEDRDYTVQKVHRDVRPVEAVSQANGQLEFDAAPALTGELQIFKVSRK
ncbi:hypothetical protein [Cerasicoccus arenae]|nr:hypothetical protein [Cerasicoccus arenae]MBK1859242.1 hypothetical protein [Cerasicoccus arenae]